jgi:hypothetical protein
MCLSLRREAVVSCAKGQVTFVKLISSLLTAAWLLDPTQIASDVTWGSSRIACWAETGEVGREHFAEHASRVQSMGLTPHLFMCEML